MMIHSAAKRHTDFQRQREEEAARHSDINIVSRQSAERDWMRELSYKYFTTPVKDTWPCATPALPIFVHHVPDGTWLETLLGESVTLQLYTLCSFNMHKDECQSLICSYWFCSDYR